MGLKQDLKRIDAIVADIPEAEREIIIRALGESGHALAQIAGAIRVSPDIGAQLSEAGQSAALSAALLFPIGRLTLARVLKIVAEDCPTLWLALHDLLHVLAPLFSSADAAALPSFAEMLALPPVPDVDE
jgi:hypothetical protein